MKLITSSPLGSEVDYDEIATAALRLILPVGVILPWAKNTVGVPSLPDGWVECSGQVLSDADSPLNGSTLPDLNSNNFPRGNSTSGGSGGSTTHSHTVTPDVSVQGSGSEYSFNNSGAQTTSGGNSVPPYIDVVYIIKVR